MQCGFPHVPGPLCGREEGLLPSPLHIREVCTLCSLFLPPLHCMVLADSEAGSVALVHSAASPKPTTLLAAKLQKSASVLLLDSFVGDVREQTHLYWQRWGGGCLSHGPPSISTFQGCITAMVCPLPDATLRSPPFPLLGSAPAPWGSRGKSPLTTRWSPQGCRGALLVWLNQLAGGGGIVKAGLLHIKNI